MWNIHSVKGGFRGKSDAVKSNLLAQMGQEAMTDAPKVEPSTAKRTVESAHDAKVQATGSWIRGHITDAEHRKIHKRADEVIKKKGKK